jgi:hypothetical protein
MQAMVVADSQLPISLVALAGWRHQPWSDYFLLRANQNVRAKERLVNSVFLVQLRKMFATDLHGCSRIKNLADDGAVSRVEGLGSVCG